MNKKNNIMSYEETMRYITETAKFGSNYGLQRTEKILEFLGNPHKKLKLIHIAGTNGKGSTTSLITSVLMDCGYKVGMYTSPFIEEFEERIQINRKNISKKNLSETLTEVRKAVNKVIKLGYDNPTEFEIITCLMFLYFYKEKVDLGVIEVGLGGRLDSTNVITPILSVITSISYDHINILGNSLEKIAYEKGGVIKENIPVVSYKQDKKVRVVIEKICKEKNSILYEVDNSMIKHINPRGKNFTQELEIRTENEKYNLNLSLLGSHQTLNCLLAVKACEILNKIGVNIGKDNIINGIKHAKWIGRMEVLQDKPLVVIDGAHNIDGIEKLTKSIKEYFAYKKINLIIGVLGDKEVHKMINEVSKIIDKAIILSPHSDRAEKKEIMAKYFHENNIKCFLYDDYKEGFLKALDFSDEEDLVLVCGSLYMIGDMRKIINNYIKERK